GDNIYTPCGVIGNGPGSQPGQGLYNKAELDRNGDGITDITDDACGDIPYLTIKKNFVSVLANANGTFTINYQVVVSNLGGATGHYTLKDSPAFDNDVTIINGSYSGQASGAMNTNGSTTMANNASIGAGSTHTYNVSFNVTLNLEPGSTDGGDNVYTACGVVGNGPGSQPGQGLYNKAELDINNDGITDISDDACGDIPYITMVKNLGTITANANGSYTVTYNIIVKNTGGAAGTYSLKDSPLFDDDITIVGGTFSGQASGVMNFIGSTTLANNMSISAGATHNYLVSFTVTMNLAPGSADGGDNIYTPCTVVGNGPGCSPGQGLYNKAELDRTGDGITDVTDDACGDLPYVNMVKNLGTVTMNANGTYTVTYSIVVTNAGGAVSTYTLKDTPLFDDDITIISGNYSGQASGNMNITGSTTLATGVSITGGTSHTYQVSFTVSIDLAAGSTDGGDNIYTACAVAGNGPGSQPEQGLYNLAQLDVNADGTFDIADDACGDLPYITMVKNLGSVTPAANGTYNVSYTIIVKNLGGTQGVYTLKDTPQFDDDVIINSGTYSGQASGAMNTIGFTTLANHVTINAGATHTYVVTLNVKLDLSPSSSGDNHYTPCSVVGDGPGCTPLYGLYNKAEIDWTGDNVPDITDDACGDIPAAIGDYVWHDLNGNGIQDSGEPGIPGVTVMLTDVAGNAVNDANGNAVATITTDADGIYHFTNLLPGQYIVKFSQPVGYTTTAKDKGSDNVDSDADPVTGKSHVIDLSPGESDYTIDAGYFKYASLGDYVWEDFNVNGIQENNEFGIEGVLVTLNGTTGAGNAVTASETTDIDGYYLFDNLAPGTYTVTFATLPGYTFTIQDAPGSTDLNDSDANTTTGTTVAEVLTSGEVNLTYDAGMYNLGSIGDRVWFDANGNGLQDAGEHGVNGVAVNLYKDDNMDNVPDGAAIKTTTTAANSSGDGYYLFSNLVPGKYLVEFNPANTYKFTTENVTGFATDANDVNNDSDASPFTGLSHTIILLGGENDLRIDAGIYKPLCVGDQVWEDFNNNGIIDNGELPFAGVQMALWKDLDNDGQPDTDTGMRDVTGANGKYLFTGLAPGHYVIQILPSNFNNGGALFGYTTSTGNGVMVDPDNDVNDDDNGFDPGLSVGVITKAVTLISDQEPANDGDNDINTNLTVDFGFFRVSAIGDYVWDDSNANGVQDPTESGVNNVKVYLYGIDGTMVDTMRTMSNPNQPAKQGYYLFDNLAPGSYFVKFDLPAGYLKTAPNKGGDDAKDS
ncbi:MAG TPA: SdrD B-like domain-containing protein, partial [Saprospiraceae bacterium]|nr:SdrD B-like domain-containing protein [Saprospiraceae bacterium]